MDLKCYCVEARSLPSAMTFCILRVRSPLFSKRYFLTFIDEYTRFPFAFPCSDKAPLTVMNCLTQLFSIFGTCAFILSDRWSSFQSYELKSWLLSHSVATTQTTSYNPRGNSQCEKYNDII